MPALRETLRKKQYHKQTFEIKKNGKKHIRHTLLVNPEEMTMDEPTRTEVVQTLGGANINDFGSGIITTSISGITGYNARHNADGILRDGYTEIKHLRDEVYRRFIRSKDTSYTMFWYNWEDEDYYEIHPTRFRLMRNKSQPLLYRYTIDFTILRELSEGGNKPEYSQSDLQIASTAGSEIFNQASSLNEVLERLRNNRG